LATILASTAGVTAWILLSVQTKSHLVEMEKDWQEFKKRWKIKDIPVEK